LKEYPSFEKSFLPELHELIFFYHFKEREPTIDMEKKLQIAIKNRLISKWEARDLLERLEKLKNKKEFKTDWENIRKIWGGWFYPPQSKNIYFERAILESLDRIFRIKIFPHGRGLTKSIKGTMLKTFRGLKEILNFLNKNRIDGVINGNPLVNIYEYKLEGSSDNAGRLIVTIKVPIYLTVDKFRKIVEKGYTKYRKEINRFQKLPKAKWGEKTGKREVLERRNEIIFKKYIELKKQGLSDFDIFDKIHEQLELDRYMKTWESIKPIIAKQKNRRKK